MSSKSSSRSKYSHFCIGSSTSVLKDDFVLAFETDEKFDIKSWLPFTGKMKLPTQMEVLKLILFLRDEAGRKNQWVRAGDLYRSVAEVVQRYWARAGFITKSNIERDVEKIHQEYKLLLKNKNKTTQSFVKSREEFLMSENEKGEKIWAFSGQQVVKDNCLSELVDVEVNEEEEEEEGKRKAKKKKTKKSLVFIQSGRGGEGREILCVRTLLLHPLILHLQLGL